MKIAIQRDVEIPADRPGMYIRGTLEIPENSDSIVVFAHGSGSGRFSPRNQFVAEELRKGGHGTLLVDLLEEVEAENRANVFDIDLLARRVMSASDWLGLEEDTADMAIGYFGASTGAAAALKAAADRPEIKAIVSRGGRPDLAQDALPKVTAPTLLIVGEADVPVIALNQEAYILLRSEKQLVLIPNATHLFEEPGALEEVARLATEWFSKYLV